MTRGLSWGQALWLALWPSSYFSPPHPVTSVGRGQFWVYVGAIGGRREGKRETGDLIPALRFHTDTCR